ncbi:MAG: SDR family oxidoreductase [Anaerolineae bacterium]|jgi:3-oxoacyl-[acyl-carrier protein] reductase|nr:SDR family oxidoreductase [Anaerolineae bacterium]MBT7073014.1 SDR family oxidoreductase [Anaerolineae bacterium]MBT7325294.1 SDR family oxidoreductase [Anaerolineae bacterium]
MNFKDKVVLITGAGRGYGRELAKAFAAQGARLALNDISPINLDTLVAEIEAIGGEAKAYVKDIAKKVPVQGLVMHVEDDFGKIDILINHSAVEPKKMVLDIDEWDWQRTIMVNLSAAFLMTQSVGRMMKENGGGVIVNLIPLAGREEKVGGTAYVSSMMGLIGFTQQAASDLEEYHVRVHAVGTGIAEMQRAETDFPSDFNEAVLYLCNEKQASLNGQIVNIK